MATRAIPVVVAASLAALACGCMDPSIYESPGGLPGAWPPARPQPTAPEATPRPIQGSVPGQAAQPLHAVAPGNNVMITIEKIGTDARTAMQADLAFRYKGENVIVQSTGNRVAERNGLWVGLASGGFRAEGRASGRRSRHTTREAMFIAVASGAEGQILMGSDTYVQRLGYWTPRGYRVLVERAMVGRSLVVRPRILGGGRVEIELWPRFTTRGARGAIDVTELATKVSVRDGQSIVIGGLSAASEDVGSVLFGVGTRARTSVTTMILTPKIGAAAFNWPKGTW